MYVHITMYSVNCGVEGRLGQASSSPTLIFTVLGLTSCTRIQTLFSQVFLISSLCVSLLLDTSKSLLRHTPFLE